VKKEIKKFKKENESETQLKKLKENYIEKLKKR